MTTGFNEVDVAFPSALRAILRLLLAGWESLSSLGVDHLFHLRSASSGFGVPSNGH
jgi:hypothetical protein